MNTNEVKQRLQKEGKTMKKWAEERGVTDYPLVRRIMNGFSKAKYGKAHAAAVALGLKESA